MQRKRDKNNLNNTFRSKRSRFFSKHLIIVLTLDITFNYVFLKGVQFMDIARYQHTTCRVRRKWFFVWNRYGQVSATQRPRKRRTQTGFCNKEKEGATKTFWTKREGKLNFKKNETNFFEATTLVS